MVSRPVAHLFSTCFAPVSHDFTCSSGPFLTSIFEALPRLSLQYTAQSYDAASRAFAARCSHAFFWALRGGSKCHEPALRAGHRQLRWMAVGPAIAARLPSAAWASGHLHLQRLHWRLRPMGHRSAALGRAGKPRNRRPKRLFFPESVAKSSWFRVGVDRVRSVFPLMFLHGRARTLARCPMRCVGIARERVALGASGVAVPWGLVGRVGCVMSLWPWGLVGGVSCLVVLSFPVWCQVVSCRVRVSHLIEKRR